MSKLINLADLATGVPVFFFRGEGGRRRLLEFNDLLVDRKLALGVQCVVFMVHQLTKFVRIVAKSH